MTAPFEITQADKDTANEIFIEAFRQHERNDEWLLQILARHRLGLPKEKK